MDVSLGVASGSWIYFLFSIIKYPYSSCIVLFGSLISTFLLMSLNSFAFL